MPDMYTTASFEIAMSEAQATKASEIYQTYMDGKDEAGETASFEAEFEDESMLVSGDGVDVGELQVFLLGIGADVGLTGILVVEWAQHCSKKAPGEFGGGAFTIDFDRGEVVWETATGNVKEDADKATALAGPDADVRTAVATHAAAAAHRAMTDFYDLPEGTSDVDAIRRIAALLAGGYVPHVRKPDEG